MSGAVPEGQTPEHRSSPSIDEELIELARAIREEQVRQHRDDERGKCPGGAAFYEEEVGPYQIALVVKARLESLLSDRAKLEEDWFDKAIRDHADEHGPSGSAWNISMVLDRLHRARAALNRSTDR